MARLRAYHRRARARRASVLVVMSLGLLATVATAGSGPRAPLVQEISTDPFTNPTSQHETQVEPDSFSFGRTVVAAFQSGRFFNGGATDIGWATSKDGGRTWTRGFLGLTRLAPPGAPYDRVSDPAVAYDAAHRVWLVSTLPVLERGGLLTGLAVSRSRDGLRWGRPVTVAPIRDRFGYDKNWIVCDNGRASRFRGRCYISYTNSAHEDHIATVTSTDGGLTWSAPVESPDPVARGVGAQPVVRPNGDLVIAFLGRSADRMIAIRSADGGRTFSAARPIASVRAHGTRGFRGFQLPSAEVDAAGRIFVAWHDCRFSPRCSGTERAGPNDIVYASSPDGVGWTRPRRVPTDRPAAPTDDVLPGLAVNAETRGARTRLALVYYSLTPTPCTVETCRLDAHFVSSNNAGRTWSAPRRLSSTPMSLGWVANTNNGRMVGDYFSTSFVARTARAVAVFTLARPPDRVLRESTFAATVTTAAAAPPPLPRVSVTLSASHPTLVYGDALRLAGAVSSRRAGETVVILRRARVRTGRSGAFSVRLRPRVSTTFRARWRGRVSETIAVSVRPRVTLNTRGRLLVARVRAARPFAGRRIFLQRLVGGSRWQTIGRAVLDRRSVATFRSVPPGTSVVRAFLPRRQAGRGYLAGFSRSVALGTRGRG